MGRIAKIIFTVDEFQRRGGDDTPARPDFSECDIPKDRLFTDLQNEATAVATTNSPKSNSRATNTKAPQPVLEAIKSGTPKTGPDKKAIPAKPKDANNNKKPGNSNQPANSRNEHSSPQTGKKFKVSHPDGDLYRDKSRDGRTNARKPVSERLGPRHGNDRSRNRTPDNGKPRKNPTNKNWRQ
jgi:hypothetical protein